MQHVENDLDITIEKLIQLLRERSRLSRERLFYLKRNWKDLRLRELQPARIWLRPALSLTLF